MPRIIHTIIWKRNEESYDGLELKLPDIIETDIAFQLMFGLVPSRIGDAVIKKKHHENYGHWCEKYNLTNYLKNK
tara:strand:- start:813 stop:1037 length:225 start_codon:yes stop_codon:yes gene_type:complete